MRFNFFRSTQRADIQKIIEDNKKLRIANAQFASKILTFTDDIPSTAWSGQYSSNQYKTYKEAAIAIDEKYRGVAKWGCSQVGNIIDLRAYCIMAEGIQITEKKRGTAPNELEFANALLEYNDLDKEIAQEFAKEAELDGKILISMAWDKEDKNVMARFVSWRSKQYTIEADPTDYSWYIRAYWKEIDKDMELKEPYFVYKKFGGRLNSPNEAMSKCMKMLTKIDDLDRAQRDLRLINYLFAGPILNAECETAIDAAKAQENLDNLNMKIGKAIAHTGKLSYLQPAMQGVDSLEREITMLTKTISGGTGVPVHFLGYPDLLSNRATADNLTELIAGSTSRERITWESAFEEMVDKSIVIYNEKTGRGQYSSALRPGMLNYKIPIITPAVWERIEKVFIPLKIAGSIDDGTLLSQVPGIDAEEAMAAVEKQKEVNMERFSRTPLGQASEDGEDEEDTDEEV